MAFISLVMDKTVEGFTPGKIYVGLPSFSDGGLVSYEEIFTEDDIGEARKVDGNSFERLENANVVLMKEINGFKHKAGSVFLATDATEDFYYINGQNLVRSHFRLLADTKALKGMSVCHKADSLWRKIEQVKGTNVFLEGIDVPLCFTSVMFAASETWLSNYPMVVCRENVGSDLIGGKVYELSQGMVGDEFVKLVGHGDKEYMGTRFFWNF